MNTPPSDYGTIYINTITDIICDKFGSKRKRKEKEISLYLIQKSIVRWQSIQYKASIQTKILSANTPEDPEGTEGF